MAPLSTVTATCAKIRDEEGIREKWGWFFALGCGLIIMGIAAIGTPFVASITIALFVGSLLTISGVIQVIHAFWLRKWGDFIGEMLLNILSIIVGIYIFMHPLLGIALLTLILGTFLLIEGILKIFISFKWRPLEGWWWGLLSGIFAVIIGIMIILRWPYDAAWIIGVFLGVDFLVMGSSLITLALTLRRLGVAR